ncbi:MAG: hypothetical protein V1926_05045 [Candidatus Peregrinibacteria bacterium]
MPTTPEAKPGTGSPLLEAHQDAAVIDQQRKANLQRHQLTEAAGITEALGKLAKAAGLDALAIRADDPIIETLTTGMAMRQAIQDQRILGMTREKFAEECSGLRNQLGAIKLCFDDGEKGQHAEKLAEIAALKQQLDELEAALPSTQQSRVIEAEVAEIFRLSKAIHTAVEHLPPAGNAGAADQR